YAALIEPALRQEALGCAARQEGVAAEGDDHRYGPGLTASRSVDRGRRPQVDKQLLGRRRPAGRVARQRGEQQRLEPPGRLRQRLEWHPVVARQEAHHL